MRKNPQDTHAKEERARLLTREATKRREDLAKAVQAREATRATELLAEIETQSGEASVPEDLLNNARDLRDQLRISEARIEAEALMNELRGLTLSTHSDRAEVILLRFKELQDETGFSLQAGDQDFASTVERELDAMAKERAAERKHQGAVATLEQAMIDAEAILLRGDKGAEEMGRLRADLHRLWREVEAGGRPVSDKLLPRLQKLNGRIDLGRRRRQARRNLAVGTLAAVVIAGLAWFGVERHRAATVAGLMADLQKVMADGTTSEAKGLLTKINEEHARLATRPGLAAAIASTESWLENQSRQLPLSETALGELESRVGDFTLRSDPAQVRSLAPLIEELEKSVAALAKDLRLEPESRLLRLKTAYAEKSHAWANARRQETEAALNAAEAATAQLARAATAHALAEQVPAFEDLVLAASKAVEEGSQAAKLPPDTLARHQRLLATLADWKKQLVAWRDAEASLVIATDLGAYRAALETISTLRPEQDPAVQHARYVLRHAAKLDPAGFKDALLFPGDTRAALFVRENPRFPLDPARFPAFPPEREIYNQVAQSRPKDQLWRALLDRPDGRVEFNYLPISPVIEQNSGTKERRTVVWRIRRYVSLNGDEPVAEDAYISGVFNNERLVSGESLREIVPSAEAEFLKRWFTPEGIDSNNGRFRNPPALILSDLWQASLENKLRPHFTLFAEQELFRIMDQRPYNWGLHLSPSLQQYRADRARLESRPFGRADWLMPTSKRETEINRIHLLRPQVSPMEEIRLNAALVAAVSEGDFALVGGVGRNGKIDPSINVDDTFVAVLGTTENLHLVSGRQARSLDLAPLSPVFALRLRDYSGRPITASEMVASLKREHAPNSSPRLVGAFGQ